MDHLALERGWLYPQFYQHKLARQIPRGFGDEVDDPVTRGASHVHGANSRTVPEQVVMPGRSSTRISIVRSTSAYRRSKRGVGV